jgi:hypothetical protein
MQYYHGGRIFFSASECFCQAEEKSWRELATLLDMFRKKKNKKITENSALRSTVQWHSHVFQNIPRYQAEAEISFLEKT